jgi:hypothetical protein
MRLLAPAYPRIAGRHAIDGIAESYQPNQFVVLLINHEKPKAATIAT